MAVISNPEQILLDALKARVSSYSNRLVVRFRDGDVLRLVAEEFATRENSSTKLPVFTQYRFELSRQGRKIYVWISLGVFLGLPLSKNGFNAGDVDAQRLLSNNAIFSDLEMRSAEKLLNNLRNGVRCDHVFTSTTSQARCYRWVTVWDRAIWRPIQGKRQTAQVSWQDAHRQTVLINLKSA